MKKLVCTLVIATLWFLAITACKSNQANNQDALASPTWVTTQDVQGEYSNAVNRWQSHHVSNYEITVNISSSVLPPPCSSKVILHVQGNSLFAFAEIETPMPIQSSDGSEINNPECHDYGNYMMEKQFEIIENLLAGKLSYDKWSVKFDPTYGYITELIFVPRGEAIRMVNFSNFRQR